MSNGFTQGIAVATDRVAAWLRMRVPSDSGLRPLLRAIRARLPRPRPPRTCGDEILAEFAKAYPRAFFIQVGSNDATRLDPLRALILSTNWSGILIEPVPYVFRGLQRQYGALNRVALENVAISDHDGRRDFYFLREAADAAQLPHWYNMLGSFRREVVLSHVKDIPDIAQRLACEPLPCMTFESLCRKHAVANVDLIHIDVEGYDFEVIKLIDLSRFRPKILLFENRHLTPDESAACTRHLRAAGYELLPDGADTICLDVRNPAPRDRRLHKRWRRLTADTG